MDVQVHLAQIPTPRLQPVHHGVAGGLEAGEVDVGGSRALVQRRRDPLGQGQRGDVLQPGHLHQVLRVRRGVAHLLVERVPVGLLAAVGHAHHEDRQPRLAEEHGLDQGRVGLHVALVGHLAVPRPEGVPVDEEVPVRRPLALGQQVLELRGQHRGVVQDEVELQRDPCIGQRCQVLLGGVRLVQAVVDHGEAAVEVGVEDAREHVGRGEGAGDRGSVTNSTRSRRVPPMLSG